MQTQTNNTPFTYSPEIEDYIIQNGWRRIDSEVAGNESMVFIKGNNRALVFLDDAIEYKEAASTFPDNAVHILCNKGWVGKKYYKGFDGKNEFQLMMLLEFMGAIKLKDVSKQLRKEIGLKNLVSQLPEFYNDTVENLDPVY